MNYHVGNANLILASPDPRGGRAIDLSPSHFVNLADVWRGNLTNAQTEVTLTRRRNVLLSLSP